MNPVAQYLLDDCFWIFFDAGTLPEQTPLLTGSFDGTSLTDHVISRFGISREEAETEITAARKEVEL